MARKGYGRPASLVQIAGSGTTYPDDGSSPVGSNEWNANRDTTGIFGFTKATSSISSNNVNVTDSYIEITGGGDIHTLTAVTTALSTDYYPSDTSTKSYAEGDLLYLVKASGAGATNLKHQQGGAGAGKITTLTGGDKALSATVPTILMARTIGSNLEWVEYGGGTASDLDTTNYAAATLVIESEGIGSNDNDTTLPTSAAVKDYVDTQVATEDTIAELNDTTISGIASGELLKWNGSAWINQTLTEAGIVDGNLGTPSALVGTNISGTAANLTAGTATVATTVTITDNESTNESNALVFTAGGDIDGGNLGLESDGTCTYNPSTGKITATGFVGDVTGNVSGSSGSTTGNAATVTTNANLTGDVTSSGNATTIAAGAVDIAMLSATGTAGSGNFLRGDNTWTAVTTYSAPTIGSTSIASGSTNATIAGLTLTAPAFTGSATGADLTLSGNLTVNGTTTTVDTATLAVEDPLIKLASGNDSADSVDVGFYGLYDVGGTDKYAGIVRDASDGKFIAFKDLQTEPTTTVDKTATGYTKATLVADVEGNITGSAASLSATLAVASGGTGATSAGAARTALGVAIGSDVQAYDAQLDTLAALTANQVAGLVDLATLEAPASDGQFIVATGSGAFAYESGSTALASIGGVSSALADGNILVGNGSGVAASVNPSGDVDVSNAGVFTIQASAVDIAMINASGSAGSGTFLRGDGQWQAPSGAFVATATDDLNFAGDWDIEDVQRVCFEVQGTGFTLNATNNENRTGEQQMFIRTIDANTEGLFVRLKKNGASNYEEVQLA